MFEKQQVFCANSGASTLNSKWVEAGLFLRVALNKRRKEKNDWIEVMRLSSLSIFLQSDWKNAQFYLKFAFTFEFIWFITNEDGVESGLFGIKFGFITETRLTSLCKQIAIVHGFKMISTKRYLSHSKNGPIKLELPEFWCSYLWIDLINRTECANFTIEIKNQTFFQVEKIY